jgi:hypothetical protein
VSDGDIQPGGGALWLNFPTDSGDGEVSFLIVADASNTTMTLASSADSADSGQNVTYTATVDHLAGGSGTPSGTVSFYDYDPITLNATSLGQATLVDGQASLTPNPLEVGAHTIRAVYSGDSSFNTNTAEVSQTVNALLPTVSLSADDSTYNGAPYSSASVTVTGSNDTPASSLESVTPVLLYYAGSSASGDALDGAPTQPGTYTVAAYYAGSTHYTSAESDPVTFTINKATPTVHLGNDSITFNGSVLTATASVSGVVSGVDDTWATSLEGVTPTVAYYAGTDTSGTPLSSPPSQAGTYTAVASFPGSTDYAPVAPAATLTINLATPTVQLSADNITFNGAAYAAATVTVTGVTGADNTPASSLEGVSPTLIYYAGSSATGDALPGAPTQAGTYTVVAHFPGSTDYIPVDSAPVTFIIARAAPTFSVSGSGSVLVAGVDNNPASSLEDVAPSATYYAGSSGSGEPLSGVPTEPGTYSVVIIFAGSEDYLAADTTITFTIG